MPLYAGLCETNITPPLGVWMAGYAYRPSGCTSVHDELYARAAVLTNGSHTVALLSMDLIGLDFESVGRVRAAIAERLGTRPEAVMLNATHTHGGPAVRTYNAMGEPDPAYLSVLERKLVGIAAQAYSQLVPASIAYGRSHAQIGINRRAGEPGRIYLGRNFAGPVSTLVHALVIRDSRKEPIGALFSHACHPTTLGGENLAITADFCGYACETVRAEMGDLVPMYLQACCGNINPNPRGTFEDAEDLGMTLGLAAAEAIRHSEPVREADPQDMDFVEESVELPLLPPPPEPECANKVEQCAAEVEDARREGKTGRILFAEGMLRYAQLELEAARKDQETLVTLFAMQRITVAGVHLLGMPAEMFVQYQNDFERQSRAPVMALGFTNGVHGYVPTAADYPLGGYEVEMAHKFYHTLMFAPECERLIRDKAYDLLNMQYASRVPYMV